MSVEWVAGSSWNQWPDVYGIGGRMAVESANNRELPVCLYDELKLSSTTGLNEVVQISRNGVGEAFAKAILDLARVMPSERVS
ncbi:hypothetical protein [Pseudomonas proteolytica]|uniref:hypothetical protein n=1 Tax=Pseudomonas proteolytica TaxID=219574 RepID=UPI0014760691|nr:hypothetical protein [Pseudomonas proteolytica]NMZ40560.1 hypothetical protein [Pseudomonas proteolytica]